MESSVLHRELRNKPRLATHSLGHELHVLNDLGDRNYLDLSSGAGITCLGHSITSVKEAICQQVQILPYVHSGNFTAEPVEQLADELLQRAGFAGGGVMFLNTGAEAVEGACKLGMQYWLEASGISPALFARRRSYHGNTLFTLALGDHPRKHQYRDAIRFTVHRLPAFDHSVITAREALNGLRQFSAHPKTPFIVVVEPIGGTTIGIQPSTVQYLTELRRVCNEGMGLLIYDEVLCGNFRTGKLFAYQHYAKGEYDLAPDIICVGKGVTAGYFPLSAVICNKRVRDGLGTKLWHSTTNQNHPVGCAAGVAAFKAYDQHLANVGKLSAVLTDLRPYVMQCKHVVGIEGVGTLWGVRLDPSQPHLHAKVRQHALTKGLALYSDGTRNMVLLAPPYCLQEQELEQGLELLADVLWEVEAAKEVA